MSTITIASVPRITSTELSTLLLRQQQQQQQQQTPTPPQSLSIIDVRTTDHIGGHIITSTHVPATSLDHRIPALVRDLKDKKTVVFHCALSHQRGPGAAVQYLRERRRVLGEEKEGEEEQKVLVLDGGFVQWQEK
ncbi:MAG: hypothetical protein M1840_002837 [Geoglossum simile]|nr:MAG: hypothetical protein M1840_002837 [Geoglossum simile]